MGSTVFRKGQRRQKLQEGRITPAPARPERRSAEGSCPGSILGQAYQTWMETGQARDRVEPEECHLPGPPAPPSKNRTRRDYRVVLLLTHQRSPALVQVPIVPAVAHSNRTSPPRRLWVQALVLVRQPARTYPVLDAALKCVL